jgi:hypothetical protein
LAWLLWAELLEQFVHHVWRFSSQCKFSDDGALGQLGASVPRHIGHQVAQSQ